ncbi:MAG TPA: hypothetical protein VFP17_08825 [Solirubrobacterales bacterium]|nr:hypothetical protein [Solirubrobacterales bacterium]
MPSIEATSAPALSSRQVAVCTAFHSETAWRTLLARTMRTKVRSGKTVGRSSASGTSR